MMTELDENIWLIPYELKALGVNIGRNVTIIRLASGQLIIHSTAPFSPAEIAAIHQIGPPGWLVEAMVDHDTFSKQGRGAFPEIPFLAPPGFQQRVDFPVADLDTPPSEWLPEIEVIPIHGIPKMAESVLFHHPSGTLVVCDLLFHFPDFPSLWAKLLLSAGLGWNPAPGFSKRVKMSIEDHEAFRKSVAKVMQLPIKRIIPGHGVPLENHAKQKAQDVLHKKGFA